MVAGRSPARETAPVKPVSDEAVERTCLFLSQTVRDAVVFMRLTGCRPGEAFRLRWRDVDRSGDVWLYYPSEWKTEHCRTRRRVVPIATRVRQILERYAAKTPDEPIFSPRDAQREKLELDAITPDEPIFSPRDAVRERYANPNGGVSDAVVARIERTAAEYNKNSFRRAIERAAIRAGVEPWGPNRLRHAAATEIRAKAGLEAAQVVLGHASAKTTEIYAETAVANAVAAVARVWGDER